MPSATVEIPVTGKSKTVTVPSKVESEKLIAARARMNKARLARQKLNDFENNTKFQKWAKNAKVMNLTIKNGKDILYGVIETIESFDLKVSLTNFDDFLSVYFEGVSRSVLKAWIKERNLVRNIKVSYVEYLQNLLNEKGMDYLTKSEYMEEQA